MAGSAKTEEFILGSATVMLGPMADLMDLNVAEHSIGLVKNVSVSAQNTFTDLTQGVTNSVVASIATGNDVSLSMEVYEFTAKNLAYGLGLSGAYAKKTVEGAVNSEVSAESTTVDIAAASDNTSDFPAGAAVVIQGAQGSEDEVHISKVVSASFDTDTTTVTIADATPAGVTFPVGAKLIVVNELEMREAPENEYFSAKIVGVMPMDKKPIALIFPKVKITQGFNLAFGTDDFSNMPFEIAPQVLVATDALYANFKGVKGKLLRQ